MDVDLPCLLIALTEPGPPCPLVSVAAKCCRGKQGGGREDNCFACLSAVFCLFFYFMFVS